MNHFALITDTHYWPGAPRDFGAPKMLTCGRQIHDALVPAVNALNPEFVVHGGDILCGGGSFDLPAETYEQSIREVRERFDAIRSPFYIVPGNHDCDAQAWEFKRFNQAFDVPDTLAVDDVAPDLKILRANVFLGNTKEQGSGEWTDEHDELLRAADRRAIADHTASILFLHSWVLADSVPEDESEGRGCVEGARRLLDTVSQCPSIAAIFTGHRHVNRITAYRDFLVVDTACLIGYPFGFREIWLSDDGWLSTHFHRLDVPEVMTAYRSRDDIGPDREWEGQSHDCDCEVLIPRLSQMRRR